VTASTLHAPNSNQQKRHTLAQISIQAPRGSVCRYS
jgi:hypothetical protein